jgi:HAE1 family hydrophobic/amphiphilic exporter-1
MHQKGLGPVQAARESMREVTGAVIAISIVLIAVFVPVSFFPGTTGAIYRQFALTIAASVTISTFCALTLTPALSALLLRHQPGAKWVVFRKIESGLDALRDGYGRVLGRLLRHPIAILVGFLIALGSTIALFRSAPTGFIPDEDQGYLIVSIQGPEGMSLTETEKTMIQVENVLKAQPEIRAMFAPGGFSFQGNGPNIGMIFALLKPWDERKGKDQTVQAVIERIRRPLAAIGSARVLPFLPPAIRGVGQIGGFQFMVEDRSGTRSLDELSATIDGMIGKSAQDPKLRGVFTTFTAATPVLDVEVDRQKAKALGVPIDQIFSTLQLYMGSQYVNDFNYASRTYRVYMQADKQFRDTPEDIGAFYVRNEGGQMIPLEGLVRVTPTTSAQNIRHYNLFRSAEVNGGPAPGVSSGEALAAMEKLAAATLPEGMATEWTGASLEQKESGGQTAVIFALGLLFVFLVLSAQYESFVLPFVIILSVPLAILGALGLQLSRGYANDVFCQIGLVMLIGLSSKNAILIVEFAEQLREQGKTVIEAAILAATTRLRPILMTSIAFLLGVVPLMLAGGAGAAARNSLGTTVFGGMAVSTAVNLIVIPSLYVLVTRFRRAKQAHAPHGGETEAFAPGE